MEIRRVTSQDAVVANRGRVALERGPLAYCFEGADQAGSLSGLELAEKAPLGIAGRTDLAGGMTTLKAGPFTAVPYYAWSHRGPEEMAVWVRTSFGP